jgi:mRNA interferase MazF
VVRGELFHLPAPRARRGREQLGARYAIVVQSDDLLGLSTVIVSPTSTSALPASFRPTITVDWKATRVLVEQTTVVDPQRLGRSAGRLEAGELRAVDESLALVLGL